MKARSSILLWLGALWLLAFRAAAPAAEPSLAPFPATFQGFEARPVDSSLTADWLASLEPETVSRLTAPDFSRQPADGAQAPRRGGAPSIFRYYGFTAQPTLEVLQADGSYLDVPLELEGGAYEPGETLWKANLAGIVPPGDWAFRVRVADGVYDTPAYGPNYFTQLATLWVRQGQIYNYPPARYVSAPVVLKIPNFVGSMPTRNLYVYLPRGYLQHTFREYPVVYLQDGQQAFIAFNDGPFGVTLEADRMATLLISEGRMRECVMVGIPFTNFNARFVEYMPPYASYGGVQGTGAQMAGYYMNEVRPYIASHFRVKTGREDTGIMGGSMGGLFSTYVAWEFPEFVKHAVSFTPAYWIMRDATGRMEVVERLRTGTPRDIRQYMDSGTTNGGAPIVPPDDGLFYIQMARDAMIENGYVLGDNLDFFVKPGDGHGEYWWRNRTDRPMLFMFPSTFEPLPTEPSRTGWSLR